MNIYTGAESNNRKSQERYLDLRRDTPCRHSVTNIYEAQYKGHKAQSVEPEAAACYLFVNMGWIEDPWR